MFPDISESRDSYRFAGRVDPLSTETHSVVMDDPCTVEAVRVRFYAGPRLDLKVNPYVKRIRGAGADEVPLINFPEDPSAKDVIDGEDDDFGFDVSREVDRDDEIVVEVENQNDSNAYDFVVDVVVDFEGGTMRPLSSLFNRLSGVFA